MISNLTAKNITLLAGESGGGGKVILDGVNATFTAGRMALIAGETGAGKTTLLNILACLLRPTEGTVFSDENPVSGWISSYRDKWRQKVGFVFQQPHLLSDLSVSENVMLPLIPRGFSLRQLRAMALDAMKQLRIKHLAGYPAKSISGGEAQRVAVARAIITEPAIILADEPTAHQDSEHARLILDIFEKFKTRQAIVVVSAHDPRVRAYKGFEDHFDLKDHVLRQARA